ncbi:MAG: DEAD/DEAH box helicase [Chitinophagaceae bacterium]|nr:DEAD/DEAH box helicase [Oligoflexus sp.]
MAFESRPYQSDAVRAVITRYQKGQTKLLLRLPTGAGKTVISALLIDELLTLIGDKNILFLAHRREIINQTAEKIAAQIGSQFVTVEQAERRSHSAARVVVASVQTLAGRLDEFSPEAFGVVIVDECHHAYAKTWMDTISHFGKREATLLLGLTATPKRSDGRSIGELFGEIAFEISLGELQDRGYLVPMDYATIEASLGLSDMRVDASGDFQTTLLGKIMNTPEMRELTLRACEEKAPGKKTIAFCASVTHAQDLAKDFAARGISSAFVSGQSLDRDESIKAFRRGDIQVLTNYGVLTEGFDDPSIECVLLARPTTSPLVYSQCLGRGLRSFPGKKTCIVIDIVDRQRHQLQYNVYEAAGLSRSWQGSGKDPLREAEAIARIRVTEPAAFLRLRNALSLSDAHKILMELDPRTVLAGIDGLPMVRYHPAVYEDDEGEKLSNAARLLSEAGWAPKELKLGNETLHAVFSVDGPKDVSPYLEWHLRQATGLGLSYTLVEETKVELPQALPPPPAPVKSAKTQSPKSDSQAKLKATLGSTKPGASRANPDLPKVSLTDANADLKARLGSLAQGQPGKRLDLRARMEEMKKNVHDERVKERL